MREFIQKNADEVAIVVYDAPLPPKYFRLTKRFIKTLFVVVPLFLILIFSGLFLWGFGLRLKATPTPALPEVINQTDNRIAELEAQVQELQQTNEELTTKIAQGAAVTTAEDPHLMVIKKPYGMQNLLAENRVTLDNFQLNQDDKRLHFKFQIISATPEKRVTGHVIVFMLSPSGMIAYPQQANATLSTGVKYSAGETFSVSRLRPTDAEFPLRPPGENVKFVIYIFNREGDLLLVRETESFKVGPKS